MSSNINIILNIKTGDYFILMSRSVVHIKGETSVVRNTIFKYKVICKLKSSCYQNILCFLIWLDDDVALGDFLV